MFEVDTKSIKQAVADLETFAKKAVPFAVRNGLNRSAFAARKMWQQEIGRSLINRNAFTVRSVRVEMARGLRADAMEATVGSIAKYMGDQEKGTRLSSRGKHGKPVPTAIAAGQAKGSQPIKRLVRRPNRMGAIRLKGRGASGGRKQRNAIAIAKAKRSGAGKFAFLELERSKGIFKIPAGKRGKVRMIWDMSRKSVRIPATPTLQRTLKRIEPKLAAIHKGAVIQQLKRHRILGY